MSQMLPSELEVSIAGDFNVQEVLDLVLKYLGTVPANANSEYRREGQGSQTTFGSVPALALPGKFLELES